MWRRISRSSRSTRRVTPSYDRHRGWRSLPMDGHPTSSNNHLQIALARAFCQPLSCQPFTCMQVDKRLDVYVGMQEVIKRWATWSHMLPLRCPLSLSLSAFLVFSYLFFTLASGRSCQAGGTWRQFEKSKVWKVLLTHQSCAPASSCPFCVITSNVVRVVVLVKDFRMLLPVIFVFHHNISQLIFLALRCYFELAQVIFCPLVAELLDPSMRPRHWTALVNLCGASKVICWYANHVRSRSWHLEVS